jgi:multimeric flavodoxin WrbA
MKKIVAVNASPRGKWNTAQLVEQACLGAKKENAQVKYYDLYKQEKFTGCISCFGCMLEPNKGRCVCKDGLTEILEDIRTADGLIVGTPNYLGDVSAGFRALFERLVFQHLTYRHEVSGYETQNIPVLFIMTSNVAEDLYDGSGYTAMLDGYKKRLERFIGPVKFLISGQTKQVNDYSKFDWTYFDAEFVENRHKTVFPMEKAKAYALGSKMVSGSWEE